MRKINSIAIFCGSSQGNNPHFTKAAQELGSYLANNKIKMIYGGARVGLMGELANACLFNNGHVVGIIPGFLSAKEIIHEGLTETIQTKSMHERKALMEEMADAFIAIPGGFGTLDELFEILTWSQLGLHTKPIGIINTDGFFDPLLAMIQKMEDCQLLKTIHKDMILLATNVTELIEKMNSYQAPEQPKWIKRVAEI
ncbi:MAG: TIGR00730 family Rossman fold protein [Chitinophagales bacterium]|nr:TIGR00730 family Rossman fold protein [Chitinophagales bacterium]